MISYLNEPTWLKNICQKISSMVVNSPVRENFLKNLWLAYPEMPLNCEHYGRFFKFKEKQFLAEIEIKPSRETLKVSKAQLADYIQDQDVVALEMSGDKVQVLWLLAPHLSDLPRASSSFQIQSQWQDFLQSVQKYFLSQNFLSVQTPILSAAPGTEPFIDLFKTEFVQGQKKQALYALSSPELSMKKLLAQGYERIFEIRPCFRNGEISEHHQPEFMMLEWYRAFSRLEVIKQDVKNLLGSLKPGLQFNEVTMAELFKKHLQFTLTPQTSFQDLKVLAEAKGLNVSSYEHWDDIFYLLFVEKVEPFIDSTEPIFVTQYPPSQAALARLTPEGWGDRFELYWQGLEIANAFHELNDPKIQEERFHEDLLKKKEKTPLDQDFLNSLKAGLPPSGGIALGLERLFMALYKIKNIQQIKLFPY